KVPKLFSAATEIHKKISSCYPISPHFNYFFPNPAILYSGQRSPFLSRDVSRTSLFHKLHPFDLPYNRFFDDIFHDDIPPVRHHCFHVEKIPAFSIGRRKN